MPRPPLPIGSYGEIWTRQLDNGWVAMAKFRDFDGVTRPVERRGRSKAAAIRALKAALSERGKRRARAEINPDSKFEDVARKWLTTVEERVDAGDRSPTTLDQYRSVLNKHVIPAFAGLRIGREVTVPVLEAFLQGTRTSKGLGVAKTARSVLSGVMGHAVRNQALDQNPVRETSRLEGASAGKPGGGP